MIQFVKREDIDVEKYDRCIKVSKQSKIFGFSWYLDIVVERWAILMVGDYETVMPLPVRKKMGITYVYPPFWMLEMGIFSVHDDPMEDDFLTFLRHQFKWVELRLNNFNNFHTDNPCMSSKKYQLLDISISYQNLFNNYRKDRKKDLKRASSSDLHVKWQDDTNQLISLFKSNIGLRTPKIKAHNYEQLRQLVDACVSKNKGIVMSIYQEQTIVASAFILLHQKTMTILVSSTDLKNRNNGANTFLIDQLIQKHQKEYQFLNFGGSSISSIASYFLSFGAQTIEYPYVRLNQLPFFMRLFKK